MNSLIKRFQGSDGTRVLQDALRAQSALQGADTAISEISPLVKLEEHAPGKTIIEQDGIDNDLLFIISGKVGIVINEREIAERFAGQHVGEMSFIDPAARRSATVIAKAATVTARISEADFGRVANGNPQIWRRIAVELGQRLRQRSILIRPPNSKPHIFVGSSAETLPICREIQLGFKNDPFVTQVWTDDVFSASKTTIEVLETQLGASDFAILVLAPDDLVISRKAKKPAPRDNVIFELGLFMGALTRDRTFVVQPKDPKLKVPSDLLGMTSVTYATDKNQPIAVRIATVCTEIRKLVSEKGPR
jgi:CRP/FNR family cyclic AMP-dependent transcriptional regulator